MYVNHDTISFIECTSAFYRMQYSIELLNSIKLIVCLSPINKYLVFCKQGLKISNINPLEDKEKSYQQVSVGIHNWAKLVFISVSTNEYS